MQNAKLAPVGFIVIPLGLWMFFHALLSSDEPPKPAPAQPVTTQAAPARDPEYSRKIEVQSCTQLYVEGMLKSPSTAKHPWVLASDIVTKVSEGQYRIKNYVDAENAYGAMLRAYYSCGVSLSDERCSNVVCQFE